MVKLKRTHHLSLYKELVHSFLIDEFFMSAHLLHSALVNDNNLVSILNSTQSMSNKYYSFAFEIL